MHYANNNKTEWIIKNDSSIPAPHTAIGGAQVLIKKGKDVLVLEEKTRKGLVSFPAGTADANELIETSATRELKEEVGLSVDPEKLALIAMINRLRVNRYGASSYNHFYLVDAAEVKGDIKLQPEEIIRSAWIPLEDLASKPVVHGLNVAPALSRIAKHVLDGCKTSRSEMLADYRQLGKKDNECNPKDTMKLYLFSANYVETNQ